MKGKMNEEDRPKCRLPHGAGDACVRLVSTTLLGRESETAQLRSGRRQAPEFGASDQEAQRKCGAALRKDYPCASERQLLKPLGFHTALAALGRQWGGLI